MAEGVRNSRDLNDRVSITALDGLAGIPAPELAKAAVCAARSPFLARSQAREGCLHNGARQTQAQRAIMLVGDEEFTETR